MKVILFLCLIISGTLSAKESQYIPYIIQEGDNVSKVLKNHKLAPLYGNNKWVENVLKLNRLDQQSARKLEVGDVIIVPYKTHVIFTDDIKTMQSSIRNEIELESISPKTYNTTIRGGYFVRNYTYDNQDNNVNLNQNFVLIASYKERKINLNTDYLFNPEVSFSVYTQSNANFNSDNNKVAEFTPSTLSSIGMEIEQRETNISLTPTIEHEYFSALDFDSEEYTVIKETQFWIGFKTTKYFYNKFYHPYIQANAFIGSLEKSKKHGASLGLNYKNRYNIEVSYNETKLVLDQETTLKNASLVFGYQF